MEIILVAVSLSSGWGRGYAISLFQVCIRDVSLLEFLCFVALHRKWQFLQQCFWGDIGMNSLRGFSSRETC